MGSGSLAAMAVFESYWTPKMTREAAIELIVEAVEAGIFNDLGSGSNVDVCIIEEKGTEMLRNYKTPNEKVAKAQSYKWRRCVPFSFGGVVASEELTRRLLRLAGEPRHGPRRVRSIPSRVRFLLANLSFLSQRSRSLSSRRKSRFWRRPKARGQGRRWRWMHEQ